MQLYHHIFLSYSPPDYHAMLQVHNFLTSQRLQVCNSPREVEVDEESWRLAIENAINFSGCVVIILSPDAKEAKWLKVVIDHAQAQGKKIFPILARGEEDDAIPPDLLKIQRIDICSDLAQLPGQVKEIRQHLGIPEPPAPKPEPPPNKKPILVYIALGFGVSTIVLFIAYSWLRPDSVNLLDAQTASAMSSEKSATYEQGTLKVLDQRSNLIGSDLLRRENVRIYPPPSGMYYYAVELEFECLLVYCERPPEAGIILTSPNGGQPAYPLNYLSLPYEGVLQPVGLGVKTRGWIIFSMADAPETLIINPGNNLDKQQIIVLN